jgi:hypothetical protein
MSKTNNEKLTCFGSLVVHYSCIKIEKTDNIISTISRKMLMY